MWSGCTCLCWLCGGCGIRKGSVLSLILHFALIIFLCFGQDPLTVTNDPSQLQQLMLSLRQCNEIISVCINMCFAVVEAVAV